MKFIKIIIAGISIIAVNNVSAQSDLTSNFKSLAIFNPALQNYDYEKLSFSNSVFISPFLESNPYTTYTSILEFNFKDRLRIGAHVSTAETRLTKFDSYKIYGSYRFTFENEASLSLGAELGYFADLTKVGEFNHVWSPNKFAYTDSSVSEFDFGLGIAFNHNGWTFGLGLNKLNKPSFVPFPEPIVKDGTGTDTFKVIIVDTSVVYGADYKASFSINNNFNVIYEWEINTNLRMMHSLHITNVDFYGVDYVGFQNFLIADKKYSAGLGMFSNGETGYIASAGVTLFKHYTLEISGIFQQDLFFESDGDIYLENTDQYVNRGMKPYFEANLRIDF